MMRTRCIDRQRWTSFAEELTNRHRGWIVDMEILDPRRGIRQESRRSPFHEINIDTTDANGTLFLTVGDDHGKLSHWVRGLRSFWYEERDDGLPEALELESDSGERTIVRFDRVPPSRQLRN